jgi:hypothetical protein
VRKIALTSFVAAVSITSFTCTTLAQTSVPTMLANPTVIAPGWQCLLTPTAFDGPGSLFSVSPDGTKSRIVDLEKLKLVRVRREPSTLGTITSDKKVEGSVALTLLEKIIPGLGAKFSAGAHAINVSRVAYANVIEETTYETELTPVLNAWIAKNSKQYMPRVQGVRYFIVRDAYQAGLIDYHFSKDDLVQFGGEASFKQIAAGSGSFSKGADSSYDLKQTFSLPLRVCVRTFEIGQTKGLAGASEYAIVPGDGEVPLIKFDDKDDK